MDKEFSSFRDQDGFVFYNNEKICRAINSQYYKTYQLIKEKGLYTTLFQKGLLIHHQEATEWYVDRNHNIEVVLEVDKIPFISYPYEWSFSQLKDAALHTLRLQNFLLDNNFSLKDASAYNVQFLHGKPIFIDTLSIEILEQDEPWKAYRQFCQHFLSPLLLMKYGDIKLQHLLKSFIDGIPLDTTIKLLPGWLRFRPSVYTHIYLQQKFFSKFSAQENKAVVKKISVKSKKVILENLYELIKGLSLHNTTTEWGDYYNNTNYEETSSLHKKEILAAIALQPPPQTVWDLGGNSGAYSRVFSEQNIHTVCFDVDPIAVEKNYKNITANKEKHLLPLLLDITNPSPGIGWSNKERRSIGERMRPDLILCLALIHHLFITYNCSFEMISTYLVENTKNAVVEFIPIEDSQVQKLIRNRKDSFEKYTISNFEKAFSKNWQIESKINIKSSHRLMYILKKI
jgi:hypothetical protein